MRACACLCVCVCVSACVHVCVCVWWSRKREREREGGDQFTAGGGGRSRQHQPISTTITRQAPSALLPTLRTATLLRPAFHASIPCRHYAAVHVSGRASCRECWSLRRSKRPPCAMRSCVRAAGAAPQHSTPTQAPLRLPSHRWQLPDHTLAKQRARLGGRGVLGRRLAPVFLSTTAGKGLERTHLFPSRGPSLNRPRCTTCWRLIPCRLNGLPVRCCLRSSRWHVWGRCVCVAKLPISGG